MLFRSVKICAICGRIYNKKVLCIPRIPWENILQEECNPWENTLQEEIIIKKQDRNMILDIGNILVSSDIITEQFCCDIDACKGICCVEGDAGAPVTLEEIGGIEDALDTVWGDMSAQAQAVVDKQGVAYTDRDGDLVTSIVGGKDCVFTCYEEIGRASCRERV